MLEIVFVTYFDVILTYSGVDEAAFRKTIDLRRERWAVEEDLRGLAAVKEEMEGLLKHRLTQQKVRATGAVRRDRRWLAERKTPQALLGLLVLLRV